jgi:hypothetical protein
MKDLLILVFIAEASISKHYGPHPLIFTVPFLLCILKMLMKVTSTKNTKHGVQARIQTLNSIF